MHLVIIESPFKPPPVQPGDPPSCDCQVSAPYPHPHNACRTLYARRALLDSLERGEAPLASHLLYTQVWDDNNPDLRRQGIEAGLAWGRVATLTAAYEDLGLSEGMRLGIDRAMREGRPVVFRKLGPCTPVHWDGIVTHLP